MNSSGRRPGQDSVTMKRWKKRRVSSCYRVRESDHSGPNKEGRLEERKFSKLTTLLYKVCEGLTKWASALHFSKGIVKTFSRFFPAPFGRLSDIYIVRLGHCEACEADSCQNILIDEREVLQYYDIVNSFCPAATKSGQLFSRQDQKKKDERDEKRMYWGKCRANFNMTYKPTLLPIVCFETPVMRSTF